MERPSIVFLVNGGPDSAMGIRAQSFAERLGHDFDIRIGYRSADKARSILRFVRLLLEVRPALCYVFDMAFSGVIAAASYGAISRCRMVVDTGDAIYELSKSSGERGRLGLWLTKLLEQLAMSRSDRLVVRSHRHQELLAQRGILADVIPDGVDTTQFCPSPDRNFRRQHNLEGFTVIGLLGSIVWNSRWQMCYGWELLEALDRLRNEPVKGLIIGDGSGLANLKARSAALGLEDRIVFAGRAPYAELPAMINAMDICLSTQTNDKAGEVRTTGKLPLYLACGRYVLSTDVGEAARVLPSEMLVRYHGTKDAEYPNRLASRVKSLLEHPQQFQPREDSRLIAETHFDYGVLAKKLERTLLDLLAASSRNREQNALVTKTRTDL